MERKALSCWDDTVCCEWLVQSSSEVGTGFSLLTLAPRSVLEDWSEGGWAFHFGNSGGKMVLAQSWNILRKVLSSHYSYQTSEIEWTKRLMCLGESRIASTGNWCQWLTWIHACTKCICTWADWREDFANQRWWLYFLKGVELPQIQG